MRITCQKALLGLLEVSGKRNLIKFVNKIGIITFYKKQMSKLRERFKKEFGHKIMESIDINTVDGFQGQEKDIIILSCVRTSMTNGIGFLGDERRMNVALTRARFNLIILGKVDALCRNDSWNSLIRDAERRQLVSIVS